MAWRTASFGIIPAFLQKPPVQRKALASPKVSVDAAAVLDKEVNDLLAKAAIKEVALVHGQFVSSYFAVPKSKRVPDKWRPILNLKKFNDFVHHMKFQMEELKWVRNWLKQFFYCAGINLKDAFLHIALLEAIRKFFRFKWNGKLYEWQVLPFGLKCSPRILRKMVKSILVFL